jgi:hypothetical protein
VAGDGNNVLMIDAETRAELVALRREALDAMALKMTLPAAPFGAPDDSGNSSGGGRYRTFRHLAGGCGRGDPSDRQR